MARPPATCWGGGIGVGGPGPPPMRSRPQAPESPRSLAADEPPAPGLAGRSAGGDPGGGSGAHPSIQAAAWRRGAMRCGALRGGPGLEGAARDAAAAAARDHRPLGPRPPGGCSPGLPRGRPPGSGRATAPRLRLLRSRAASPLRPTLAPESGCDVRRRRPRPGPSSTARVPERGAEPNGRDRGCLGWSERACGRPIRLPALGVFGGALRPASPRPPPPGLLRPHKVTCALAAALGALVPQLTAPSRILGLGGFSEPPRERGERVADPPNSP